MFNVKVCHKAVEFSFLFFFVGHSVLIWYAQVQIDK